MPHAALWVVQPLTILKKDYETLVSMPHAALWVVQQRTSPRHIVVSYSFQCRTRLCGWCNHEEGFGYVCLLLVSMPHAAIPFRPHHRFAVPLPRSRRGGFSFTVCQLLCPMRRTKTAAKLRRNVKGYGILASPADAGEVASAASR